MGLKCNVCGEKSFEKLTQESLRVGLCVDCFAGKKDDEFYNRKCDKCDARPSSLTKCWVAHKEYQVCIDCLKLLHSTKKTFALQSPRDRRREFESKLNRYSVAKATYDKGKDMALTAGKKAQYPFKPFFYFGSDVQALPSYCIATFTSDMIDSRKKDDGKIQQSIEVSTVILEDEKGKIYFRGDVKLTSDFLINGIKATVEPRKIAGQTTGLYPLTGKILVYWQYEMDGAGKYPASKFIIADTSEDVKTLLSGPVNLPDTEFDGLDLAKEINSRLPKGAFPIGSGNGFYACGEAWQKIIASLENAYNGVNGEAPKLKRPSKDDIPF